MVTCVDSIDSVASAAQPPARKIAKALARNAGSTPESGPTSMVIRSTTLAPRPAVSSATRVNIAWHMDISCTAAAYRTNGIFNVRHRTDRPELKRRNFPCPQIEATADALPAPSPVILSQTQPPAPEK